MAKPEEQAMRTRPLSGPCSAWMSDSTRSASSAPRSACAASSSPAALGTMPRGRRSNSGAPTSVSSAATWRLMAEMLTFSRAAASVSEPVRATSRK
ncbi:hypothetical protein D3C86_1444560 [compost metagenome]